MTNTLVTIEELSVGDIVTVPTIPKCAKLKDSAYVHEWNIREQHVKDKRLLITKKYELAYGDGNPESYKNYMQIVLIDPSCNTVEIVTTVDVVVGKKDAVFVKVGRMSKDMRNIEALMSHLPRRTYNTLQVGADPEIFIQERGSKKHIGAFEILPAKQDAKNSAYWDGFQAEFNTAPNSCIAFHTDSLFSQLRQLYKSLEEKAATVKKTGKRKELLLSTKTVINLTSSNLKVAKKEHMEFGCMPSFNAYKEQRNLPNGEIVPFRMAGGHLHFGWPEHIMPTKAKRVEMVKAMDAILGVAGVSLFAKYDDKRRRELYGRAGEFRLPPHGLEYRVLSNAWLIHPVFAQLVFELGRSALYIGEHSLLADVWDATEEETRECINTCNVRLAHKLLNRNKAALTGLLARITKNKANGERLFKLIMKGADSVLSPEKTVEDNWKLKEETGKFANGLPSGWHWHSNGENCSIERAVQTLRTEGARI